MRLDTHFANPAVQATAILGISLLVVFTLSAVIPFTMDEFCHYQALSCFVYPLNNLNTFQLNPAMFYLAPFFDLYLPLRSYPYEGNLQCLLYFPLYSLWPSPYSARLFGLLMLALQALIVQRLFRIRALWAFLIFLFCMLYSIPHMIDTGPISFQTTSLFLVCYLSQRWTNALSKQSKTSWMFAALIGCVLFLGVWAKLSYFFVLVPLFLLIFYYRRTTAPSLTSARARHRLVWQFWTLLAVAAVPTVILLNSKDAGGGRYYRWVINSKTISPLNLQLWLPQIKLIGSFLINPLKTAHRCLILDRDLCAAGIFFAGVLAAMLIVGIKCLRDQKLKLSFVLLNIQLFLLTLFLMSLSGNTWAMHHIALSLPFLAMALFCLYGQLRDNRVMRVLLILLVGSNLLLYLNLPRLRIDDKTHPSLVRINQTLNEHFRNRAVYIAVDWGFYYLKALYGYRNQCVLYLNPLNTVQQTTEIKKVLANTKRKAVFIGRVDSVSDWNLIKTEFPLLEPLRLPFDTGKWIVWFEP